MVTDILVAAITFLALIILFSMAKDMTESDDVVIIVYEKKDQMVSLIDKED